MFSLNENQNNQTDDGVVAEPPVMDSPATSTSPDPVTPPAPVPDETVATAPAVSSDLTAIRQEALQKLSPIVNQLDQPPEEKFKTTMMLIQASDDQSLIKVAFEAAKAIDDEKIRAEALLDIINEINYFTQEKE